jgi:hypothetical protein
MENDYIRLMPVRPDNVLTTAQKRFNEDVNRVIEQLNPQLSTGLESGLGRDNYIRCLLSKDLLEKIRDLPAVSGEVIERLKESGWVVYRASIYQWDLCVRDSQAGKSMGEAIARANGEWGIET